MSLGPIATLGGGLTLGAGPGAGDDCICHLVNPILYPPDPCCDGDGGGGGGGGGGTCGSGDGSGGGGIILYPQGGGGDNSRIDCLFDATYGGGRGSLTRVSGSLRNGAQIVALGAGGDVPCSSLVGTTPVAVPASSSGHSIQAGIFNFSSSAVGGLQLTCTESGVSFLTTCTTLTGFYTFYFNDGTSKHFTTPSGAGMICSGDSHTFSSGAASGTGTVIVNVSY